MTAMPLVSMKPTADRSSTTWLPTARAFVRQSSSAGLVTMSRSPLTVTTTLPPRCCDETTSPSTSSTVVPPRPRCLSPAYGARELREGGGDRDGRAREKSEADQDQRPGGLR